MYIREARRRSRGRVDGVAVVCLSRGWRWRRGRGDGVDAHGEKGRTASTVLRRKNNKDAATNGHVVLRQFIDNLRAELQHFVVHVARPTTKPAPVCEDHQRQLLAPSEISNGLSGLVRAVGVPDLAGLRLDGLPGVGVRRVRRDYRFHGPRFHGNNTEGNTT
jgi:hypothetical protein